MRFNIWLLILISLSFSTTYSVTDILKFIDKPILLPDITISATARGGYGTSEMYATAPTTDGQAQLLCQLDILSTAEIRDRKEAKQERHTFVLTNLADILSHQELITFLKLQKSAYIRRRNIIRTRISKGFSSQSEVFPIERFLIDIETKIKVEQSAIRKSQLNIATLASTKWHTLFIMVKKWDKAL